MVSHVLGAVAALEPRRLAVVVGPDDDEVAKELEATPAGVSRVPSNVRHDPCAAVLTALQTWATDDLDLDPDDDDVLLLPAAVPLLTGETLRAFHRAHRSGDVAATALIGPSHGAEAAVDSSVWFVRRSFLSPALRRTETPEIAAIGEVLRETGHEVATFVAPDDFGHREIADRVDLAAAVQMLQARINARWMRRGVTMLDPSRTYIDVDVRLEADVTLHPGVMLRGATVIGGGTEVGPGCDLVDCRIGARCHLDQTSAALATVGDNARVGPFAVLEPGSEVSAATVTGAFYTAGPDAR
jgi:bifunctional UDP-N-acetylglucosamine pyrophosphorylase/glucosamine-1-phosphate N-acetyltransferase